jgi:23S rRNA pseudouridine2457 synthase
MVSVVDGDESLMNDDGGMDGMEVSGIWGMFDHEYSVVKLRDHEFPQYQYLVFHKPYGVLSQFTDSGGRPTLADYIPIPNVYAAGRLDMDSEGLLLLTSDGDLVHYLTAPASKVPKTYWVQVERTPDSAALEQLRQGVVIQGTRTRPARVRVLDMEPNVPPRSVPIRFRKSVPTAWLEMEISEGMNRQIRRMTAQVGHPTLRLIRVGIGAVCLGELPCGMWRPLHKDEMQALRPPSNTSSRSR